MRKKGESTEFWKLLDLKGAAKAGVYGKFMEQRHEIVFAGGLICGAVLVVSCNLHATGMQLAWLCLMELLCLRLTVLQCHIAQTLHGTGIHRFTLTPGQPPLA